MSRGTAGRAVRWLTRTSAVVVAVCVITAIVLLPIAVLSVRLLGLSTYVVQGGPTESMLPIGTLVLIAPPSEPAVGGSATPSRLDTAWVAIPTLGYAITYAEAYLEPVVMGLVVWILSAFAFRGLDPHMSSARRRLPA